MLGNAGDIDGCRSHFQTFRQLFAGLDEDAKAADAEVLEQQQKLAQLLGL